MRMDKNMCFVIAAYAVAVIGYGALWLHSFIAARKSK